MKRRTWTPKQKLGIVLEGLQGRSVSDICLSHQICQTQYYQWRDQFLSNAEHIFDLGKSGKASERLRQENERLKAK